MTHTLKLPEKLEKFRQNIKPGDKKRYGTYQGQRKAIFAILADLAERYNHKACKLYAYQWGYGGYHESQTICVNNWYGLQKISHEILDPNMGVTRDAYRIDDDICEVLRMPSGSTCKLLNIEGMPAAFHVDGFKSGLREMAQIKRLLKTVVPVLLMKTF